MNCQVTWTDDTATTHHCHHPLHRTPTPGYYDTDGHEITALLHPGQPHACHCGAESR